MSAHEYFIGLLSGTSVDGIDAVVVDFAATPPRLIATHSEPIPDTLRARILELCSGQPVSLVNFGETDVALGRLFAQAANSLLSKAAIAARDVLAIGSHGQTVMHHPHGESPFTLQIGDPNTIAWLTGISTVADFRRKDMAAGGQGAPLAPLFHQDFFGRQETDRAVLNIGGIANITLLASSRRQRTLGFDTGPGNVLMDSWIKAKRGLAYDHDGEWASTGRVNQSLLDVLMSEPYLQRPAPKSTGRELFNLDWLLSHLQNLPTMAEEDVQATLLEFTARSIEESVDWRSNGVVEVIVCGGGAHNGTLMAALQRSMPETRVLSSAAAGLAPDWVEGVAFAWMARKAWLGEAIATGSVTGATRPCILGGIYEHETQDAPTLH